MTTSVRARYIDGQRIDPRDMSTEELEFSDYGRGRFKAIHFILGTYLCAGAIGVLYAFRVGVWG